MVTAGFIHLWTACKILVCAGDDREQDKRIPSEASTWRKHSQSKYKINVMVSNKTGTKTFLICVAVWNHDTAHLVNLKPSCGMERLIQHRQTVFRGVKIMNDLPEEHRHKARKNTFINL